MTVEKTILSNIVLNDSYSRKVFPFLKENYFQDRYDRILFNLVASYVEKYKGFPSKETLFIDLSNLKSINEDQYATVKNLISSLSVDETTNEEWLVKETEKFCQKQAVHNALRQSILIVDGKDQSLSEGAIPKILQDALGVSFDTKIGHDFLEDWELRYEYYHERLKRVPFDLSLFNKITKGGLPPKTLSVIIGGTGVGKTAMMVHMAANNLTNGHNVLYITAEMGEIGDPSISQRIDANLMDVAIDDLMLLSKEAYAKKIERIRAATIGKLIVKEYPTATANANHFRYLLNELKLKKKFVPDIIYVDYLNICASSRMRFGKGVGSYEYVKSIAEELRGLAQENNLPLVTATQFNREGFRSSDAELDQVSESFGIGMTGDFIISVTTNDQLDAMGQYSIKQLKNRMSNPALLRRFVIGVDKSKMKLFDIDENVEPEDTGPVMDNATLGKGERVDWSKFSDFK